MPCRNGVSAASRNMSRRNLTAASIFPTWPTPSRMHFAAQFRAATGYRQREYLLHQRIEHAKSLLSKSEKPLAEVALAVGSSRRLLHAGAFVDRVQAHHERNSGALAMYEQERIAFRSKSAAKANLWQAGSDVVPCCRTSVTRSCEMRNDMDSRNTFSFDLRCCGCKRLRPPSSVRAFPSRATEPLGAVLAPTKDGPTFRLTLRHQ
jgi:hypothetical protein